MRSSSGGSSMATSVIRARTTRGSAGIDFEAARDRGQRRRVERGVEPERDEPMAADGPIDQLGQRARAMTRP